MSVWPDHVVKQTLQSLRPRGWRQRVPRTTGLRPTSVQFGLLAGKKEFSTQNEEWIHKIICIVVPVYLYTHLAQEKLNLSYKTTKR